MHRKVAVLLDIAMATAVLACAQAPPEPPPALPAPQRAERAAPPAAAGAQAREDGSLQRAIAARARDTLVTGRGTVVRLLRDDREGSPHQRILVRVKGGGTVLLSHNLELGQRIAPLAVGDELEFAGEFEWNDRGGVVHWTHPDPRGRHRAGWIRHLGRR